MRKTVKLSPKQDDAYWLLRDKDTFEVGFGGGANGGKSWLGCFWLISNCFEYPGSKWFIGREELKRLRESTLLTFFKAIKYYEVSGAFSYNGQDHYLQHRNGSRIDLLDLKLLPSDPYFERYGSLEYTGGWVEEAGEIVFDAYDTLKSRVGRHLNDQFNIPRKLFSTFNPSKNWLYFYFYKPWKLGNLPQGRRFIQSLVGDNLFRESESIESLEQLENETQKQRLLYGNWEYEDAPDQVITYSMLDSSLNRIKETKGNRYMGVDVARYGDDESVIALRIGGSLTGIEGRSGLSIDRVKAWVVKSLIDNYVNADNIRVDGVGLGAGVVDMLKKDGYNVVDFIAGAKPVHQPGSKYKFKNLRSQMWWNMRELLKESKASINVESPKLLEDLTAPRYKITSDKMIEVESKDNIKRRIGRSTDYGDATVMAYAPVKKRKSAKAQNLKKLGVYLP